MRRTGGPEPMDRRSFLERVGVAATMTWLNGRVTPTRAEETVELPFENGVRPLVSYPQKRPLIRLTTRPPQLETPFSVFNEGILTPNDAFFVRYHLSESPPLEVDLDAFRLEIKGGVKNPLSLSLADLKSNFAAAEIVAVNQCSGNSRGFSQPRVPGGQLGHGAMGNARWTGVRLADVLGRAGVSEGARQVTFNGLDKPVSDKTPDFIKALELDHALDGSVLLAWGMNGEDLPMLNGYPLRLVVPGYYGTYWVKHLNEISVTSEVFNGYWMNPAYRVPDNTCACVPPGTAPKTTVPIARCNVRSFITSVTEGDTIALARPKTVKGIAFDGGYGITEVLFSADGGRSWQRADLGKDLGQYSFREWTATFVPDRAGLLELKAKATNRIGQSQPLEALWNPAGYMRNTVETVHVKAS